MSALLGTVLRGIPGVFRVAIDEPEVLKVFDREEPAELGLPTRHARYLMTYRERTRTLLPSKHLGVKLHNERTWNHLVQDVWYTDAVPAPSHDVWLRDRVHTGYEGLDRLIAAEKSLLTGFPLRVETFKAAATRDLGSVRARLAGDFSSVTIKFYADLPH